MAKKLDKDDRKEAIKGWTFLLSGVALVVKLVLGHFDISIPMEAMDQVVNLVLGVASTFGVFRNNYIGKLGQAQLRLLKNSNMQHFVKKIKKLKDE